MINIREQLARCIQGRRRWQALTCLTLVALALFCTLFSSASFNLGSKNPGQTMTAGNVKLVNNQEGVALVTGSNMKPGVSRSGSLTLTNQGDYTVTYQVSVVSISDSPASPALSDNLDLIITNTTDSTTVYSGKVSALTPTNIGTFTAGASKNYTVQLSWPSGVTNASLQGATSSFTLRWKGGT